MEEDLRIVAIIKGGNHSTLRNLKSRGVPARFVVGGILVELPPSTKVEGWCKIPEEALNSTLFIECTEHKGKEGDTDTGTVVCKSSGATLNPYKIPRNKQTIQAYFSIPNSMVSITGFRGSTRVRIQEHKIVIENGDEAKIQTKKLWDGDAKTIEWFCRKCNRKFMEDPGKHTTNSSKECDGTPKRLRIAIPHTLRRFQDAAMAAQDKANCPNGTHVHYANIN